MGGSHSGSHLGSRSGSHRLSGSHITNTLTGSPRNEVLFGKLATAAVQYTHYFVMYHNNT